MKMSVPSDTSINIKGRHGVDLLSESQGRREPAELIRKLNSGMHTSQVMGIERLTGASIGG